MSISLGPQVRGGKPPLPPALAEGTQVTVVAATVSNEMLTKIQSLVPVSYCKWEAENGCGLPGELNRGLLLGGCVCMQDSLLPIAYPCIESEESDYKVFASNSSSYSSNVCEGLAAQEIRLALLSILLC